MPSGVMIHQKKLRDLDGKSSVPSMSQKHSLVFGCRGFMARHLPSSHSCIHVVKKSARGNIGEILINIGPSSQYPD